MVSSSMETTRTTGGTPRLSGSGSEFYVRRTLSYMWVMTDRLIRTEHFFFSDDNSSRLLHKRRHEQTTWLFLASCCSQSSFMYSIDPNRGRSFSRPSCCLPGASDRKLLVSCTPSVTTHFPLRLRLVDR
ncbi:hypothetical protein BHE74_00052674 [Ensete ventricosum]|nr:hypothetical protein BHE74_00052674 [Ensete ventricosum]